MSVISKYTSEQKLAFKQHIKNYCLQTLQQRALALSEAMTNAQEAANSEEKSSAGDKYETSRAMGHLTKEMLAPQLEEVKHQISLMESLPVSSIHPVAGAGSVVACNNFISFIGPGLGNADINGIKTILLSVQAPMALQLLRKKPGETFLFNGRQITIEDVF